MTVSPFEIMSLPSIGTNLLAKSRTVFELILKSCWVETVIATSFTRLKMAILGILIFVSELMILSTLSSVKEIED